MNNYLVPLHQLVIEQAKKTPDMVAVTLLEKGITYHELDSYSEQVAKKLLNDGVQQEEIIPIMMEPSIELIVAIMGILRAGCCYLPINGSMLTDREVRILREVGAARIFIKNRAVLSLFEVLNIEKVTFFDDMLNECSPEIRYTSLPDVDIHQLSYIIYTSGSTGFPKGVMIQHDSIVNQLLTLMRIFNPLPGQQHALYSPITFDASVQQIFLPLISGGSLHLLPYSIITSPSSLLKYIQLWNIEILNVVPSLMKELVAEVPKTVGRQRIKTILIGGEKFSTELLRGINSAFETEAIYNIYGPTECTINSLLYKCKGDEESNLVPIGQPINSYQVIVLNEHGKEAELGEIGEIYISGIGLSRGYLGNETATNERFNYLLQFPGVRFYRSGDLAYVLSDGNMMYSGRFDEQVKVRGHRVDLNEIEFILLKHPQVLEAAVACFEERVHAFYVAESNIALDEIRSYFLSQAPEYMNPAVFTRIRAIPLNVNGKLDRNQLKSSIENMVAYRKEGIVVADPSDFSSIVLSVYRRVFQREVSVSDNFFHLGGDSITAIRIASDISNESRREISAIDIMERPLLSALIEYMHISDQHGSPLNDGNANVIVKQRFTATELPDDVYQQISQRILEIFEDDRKE